MSVHSTPVSIIREPDDAIAKARISLGRPRDIAGIYIVFRGEPEEVIELLELSLTIAKDQLPAGNYDDKRGRPQG